MTMAPDGKSLAPLKNAPRLRPNLPSLVTLKRMSAAGKLKDAVVGETEGRYKAALYDLDKLEQICGRGLRAVQPSTGIEYSKAPMSAPALEPQVGSPDIVAAIARMEEKMAQLSVQVEALTMVRRNLQIKYDAENDLLRQQRDEYSRDLKALKGGGSAMDLAQISKRLALICSKLGI